MASDDPTSTVTPPPDGKPVELEAVRAALQADYEILKELGRGGMAVVYKAREKELDREVAIKVLPAHMSFDAEFIERFQREARTAGKLEHPHIVPIYRVGRSGNIIYFVMKLLTGQSLASILKARKKVPVSEVRRVLMDVASALGYAAKRGVVHRDIKPDNILLDSEGRCVVTDFGIAKTHTGPHTAPGTSMGTPRYMSPEHAQGNKVDGRSDIYSLGVVGYQCLTGDTPFDADEPFAVLYKHINEPIPRPALETDDEWALYATIEKMLAKKPGDRFQTADELIEALGGEVHTVMLVHSRDSLQREVFGPTEIIPTPMPWPQRKAGGITNLAWAAGAVALLVIAGSWGAYAAWGPSSGAVADTLAARAGSTSLARAPAVTGATTTAGIAPVPGTQQKLTASIPPAVSPAPAKPVAEPYSACPRRRLSAPEVRIDSIRPLKPGSALRLAYDVCGLKVGDPFTAVVHVVRQDVGWRGTKVDVSFTYSDLVDFARLRRRRSVALPGNAPSGRYEVSVAVTDRAGRLIQSAREFTIAKQ